MLEKRWFYQFVSISTSISQESRNCRSTENEKITTSCHQSWLSRIFFFKQCSYCYTCSLTVELTSNDFTKYYRVCVCMWGFGILSEHEHIRGVFVIMHKVVLLIRMVCNPRLTGHTNILISCLILCWEVLHILNKTAFTLPAMKVLFANLLTFQLLVNSIIPFVGIIPFLVNFRAQLWMLYGFNIIVGNISKDTWSVMFNTEVYN